MHGLGISAVIPVWNEAARLPGTLRALAAIPELGEVIVVDAHSGDGSAAIAQTHGARVLSGPRRRARQLALGAAAARGAVLLFVHADTLLPAAAGAHIRAALHDPRVVGGAFRRRFAPATPVLALWSRLGDLRARFTGISFGDQAQFVRCSAFRRIGGFVDRPLAEDMELAQRLRRLGRLALLGPPVRSSPRRFARAPLVVVLRDAWFTCRHWRGLPEVG